MTDNQEKELFNSLATLVTGVKGIQSDVRDLKSDVRDLKSDVQVLKSDVQGIKKTRSEERRVGKECCR